MKKLIVLGLLLLSCLSFIGCGGGGGIAGKDKFEGDWYNEDRITKGGITRHRIEKIEDGKYAYATVSVSAIAHPLHAKEAFPSREKWESLYISVKDKKDIIMDVQYKKTLFYDSEKKILDNGAAEIVKLSSSSFSEDELKTLYNKVSQTNKKREPDIPVPSFEEYKADIKKTDKELEKLITEVKDQYKRGVYLQYMN